MADVDVETADTVAYATGVKGVVEKDGALGKMLLGSASEKNVGTDEGQIPVLGAGGVLSGDVIPGGGSGNGLPAGGTPGQIIINTASGTGAWATFTYSGSSIATALDDLDDADKNAHMVAMLPDIGANAILQMNSDADAIQELDPAGLTLTPETLIYFDDESAPQSLTILELIELFADETGMTTVVGDGALTLTYKPHITDRCGYKVEMISSVTFNEVTDLSPGAVFLVYFVQDDTGSLTLSTGSGVTFATGWDGSLNDGADEITAVLVRGGPGGETILELGETLA